MRSTGASCVAAEIVEPDAFVTRLVPAGIASSLTRTPSMTYNGCVLPRIDEMPRSRMRSPPPGAPVFDWICTDAALPCSAFWSDADGTVASWSAETLATELARLRRSTALACPVTTTCSRLTMSRFMSTSTVVCSAPTLTSAIVNPMWRTSSVSAPVGATMLKVPFSRVVAFRVVPFTTICAADTGPLASPSFTVPVIVRVCACDSAALAENIKRTAARCNLPPERPTTPGMRYLQR